MENAKLLALNFIDVVEKDIAKHLELLKSLKELDLTAKAAKPSIYDFERDAWKPSLSKPGKEAKGAAGSHWKTRPRPLPAKLPRAWAK